MTESTVAHQAPIEQVQSDAMIRSKAIALRYIDTTRPTRAKPVFSSKVCSRHIDASHLACFVLYRQSVVALVFHSVAVRIYWLVLTRHACADLFTT